MHVNIHTYIIYLNLNLSSLLIRLQSLPLSVAKLQRMMSPTSQFLLLPCYYRWRNNHNIDPQPSFQIISTAFSIPTSNYIKIWRSSTFLFRVDKGVYSNTRPAKRKKICEHSWLDKNCKASPPKSTHLTSHKN